MRTVFFHILKTLLVGCAVILNTEGLHNIVIAMAVLEFIVGWASLHIAVHNPEKVPAFYLARGVRVWILIASQCSIFLLLGAGWWLCAAAWSIGAIGRSVMLANAPTRKAAAS